MSSDVAFSWDSLAGLALLLSAALILGMRSLLLAVKVVSDGPIYHLYFAARWWKAGRLFLVAAPFGENAATYFPANGDLWFTWLLASWGGDRLAKVGQAPFLVLAALAAYGCAQAARGGRSASLVATCWFASSTPFLLYSFEPNVDTIFVAGYLMAAYFFLAGLRETTEDTVRHSASGLWPRARRWEPRPSASFSFLRSGRGGSRRFWSGAVAVRTKIVQALVVLLVPLVTGGYWYLCNAILTGNPALSARSSTAGADDLARLVWPDAMRLSPYYCRLRLAGAGRYPARRPRPAGSCRSGSFRCSWSPGRSRTRRTDGMRALVAIFSLLAILNVVLYWVFIPYRSQQRFMLQALGLAVVPLALFFDRSRWLRFAGRSLARASSAHCRGLAVSGRTAHSLGSLAGGAECDG